MLYGAKYIKGLFERDEFKPILIEGDHGFGKTTYANKLISEVYSTNGSQNWDIGLFKEHIGFHPKHILNLWTKKNIRDYCFHWDDAGLWLHSLDFQDPFVKEVGKYMQVARSDWGCVLFTSISKEDISSKIRGLRNAIVVEITKDGSGPSRPFRRTARAYIERKTWKNRPWKDYQWEEKFNCHVPDKFYNWYQPLRNKYSEMAKERMQRKLKEHKDFKDTHSNI